MWQLGDVAEVFIKPSTGDMYWEIHVTPNDFLMDIRIPNREDFMSGKIGWEEVIASSSGASKTVEVNEAGWTVELKIPFSAFELTNPPGPGEQWRFAVCRYNTFPTSVSTADPFSAFHVAKLRPCASSALTPRL